MEAEQIRSHLSKWHTDKRLAHVLRVERMARNLARQYGVSEEQATISALLHDVAKCSEPQQQRRWVEADKESVDVLQFHHELWHAPAGVWIAKETFHVHDEAILNAIRYHTTGRANMTLLEKLIYVADMIEEGRTFPGVEHLRKMVQNHSLDEVMAACIHHSIQFLVSRKVAIYPASFHCYNEHTSLM